MSVDSSTVFKDEVWQDAFRWAYILHPNRVVAYSVTFDAIDEYFNLIRGQDRNKSSTDNPFKFRHAGQALLQIAVYSASDSWERDQENGASGMAPSYRPNVDDLIVRYVKYLIWKTMDLRLTWAAVGIGSFLYTYKTAELLFIAPEYFDEHNIRRIKSKMKTFVERRFEHYIVAQETSTSLKSKPPTVREQNLVYESLKFLAPWVTNHADSPNVGESILETYFGYESNKSELERRHVLIDYECAGFQRLVEEFNESLKIGSTVMLDQPEDKLQVPIFGANSESNNSDDRFNPAMMDDTTLQSLKRKFNEKQRRRESFCPSQIRISVDGKDHLINLLEQNSDNKFQVLSDVSYIKIYGVDENEEILLEVIPLRQLDFESFKEIELPIEYARKKESNLKISLTNDGNFLVFFQTKFLPNTAWHWKIIQNWQSWNFHISLKPAFGIILCLIILGFAWFYLKPRETSDSQSSVVLPDNQPNLIVPLVETPKKTETTNVANESNNNDENPNSPLVEANTNKSRTNKSETNKNKKRKLNKEPKQYSPKQDKSLPDNRLQFAQNLLDPEEKLVRRNYGDPSKIRFEEDIDLPKYERNDSSRGNSYVTILNGTYIRSNRVTLGWPKVPGAINYTVEMRNSRDKFIAGTTTQENSFIVESELSPDEIYKWEVTPVGKVGTWFLPMSGSFRTLPLAAKQRISAAENEYGLYPLLLGIVYLKNGLIDDAKQQFEMFAKINPKSKTVKKLLKRVNELQRN